MIVISFACRLFDKGVKQRCGNQTVKSMHLHQT